MVPGEQKRVVFPATTARYFRLSISAAHSPDLQLAEFQLLRQGDVPLQRRGIKHAGGAPIYFHTDSWEIGLGAKGQQPTWTNEFRQQFRKYRGYDLVTWLPAMARRIVDDRQTTDRFLWGLSSNGGGFASGLLWTDAATGPRNELRNRFGIRVWYLSNPARHIPV